METASAKTSRKRRTKKKLKEGISHNVCQSAQENFSNVFRSHAALVPFLMWILQEKGNQLVVVEDLSPTLYVGQLPACLKKGNYFPIPQGVMDSQWHFFQNGKEVFRGTKLEELETSPENPLVLRF
ncbi:73_t:CDS:1, partial [Paraglomus occultum]